MTMYQKYEGINWGVGATMIYGKGPWVTTLDINASRTELNVVRSRINAVMVTARIGYTIRIGDFPVTWLAGVSYLWLDQRITVEQALPDGAGAMVLELMLRRIIHGVRHWGQLLSFLTNYRRLSRRAFMDVKH